VYVDGGHWLSAIAADGDGVLVARNGESALTRVDESLADAGTITLPSSWTGVRGIAVVGDRILAGGASGLGMFDRTGVQLGQASIVVQFASLRPMGPDRAAVVPTTIGDSVATVVDRNGAVVGTVAIPMEPIRSNLGYDRLVLATDWTNHVWYGEWDDEAPVYLVEAALPCRIDRPVQGGAAGGERQASAQDSLVISASSPLAPTIQVGSAFPSPLGAQENPTAKQG